MRMRNQAGVEAGKHVCVEYSPERWSVAHLVSEV